MAVDPGRATGEKESRERTGGCGSRKGGGIRIRRKRKKKKKKKEKKEKERRERLAGRCTYAEGLGEEGRRERKRVRARGSEGSEGARVGQARSQ